MRKLAITSLVGFIVMLSASSCDDILETKPESTITVNSFWQSEDDAIGGLYGMYNQFRVYASDQLFNLGEARSEVMGEGLISATNRIKYLDNSLDASNADLDWLQLYRIVDYANLVLKYVPGIDFASEETKNNILAQAFAMRAYVYFTMAKTWGGVPIITEPVEGYDAQTTFQERKPVAEVFSLVKSDIEQADKLFANNTFNKNRSIWSKPALKMLKADVFLWTGKVLGGGEADITVALGALNEAEKADVRLLDNFGTVFDYGNKGNKEVILAVNFKNLEATDNYFFGMYILPVDANSASDAATKVAIGVPGGNNYWAPTALIRDQFSQDDQRRAASFLEVYQEQAGNRSYLTSLVLKGKGFVDNGVRRFLDDIIIYRYADLLLLRAEAKNALGQNPADDINKIRKRAYGSNFSGHEFVSKSKAENDEAILQERLFEFAFEGKRWWDLVRFGKAFEKVPTLKGKESQKHLLLWPVSLQTISLNSKIEQTPGY